MKRENKLLVKINNEDLEKIGGAAGFAAIAPFVPAIITSVASIIGSFKSLTSSSGEIKTKDGLVQKWENPVAKESNSKAVTPIYFIY